MRSKTKEKMHKDLVKVIDTSYNELVRILKPIQYSKIGEKKQKILKDALKQIQNVLVAHQMIRNFYIEELEE